MSRNTALLICALAVELLALCGIAALGDLRAHVWTFLILFAVAFVAMLIAARQLRELSVPYAAVMAVTLLLRLPMLATQPTLSNDVWRYLHDGRAQVAGVSPYAYAPAAMRTAAFRGPEQSRINHPELVTIYPPVAQLAFLTNALLGSSLLLWRLLLIGCELLAVGLLARLGAGRSNLVLYAWHPLAVIEVAGSAHFEPIGIVLLLGAMLAAERHRSSAAGMLFGLSAAVKFIAAPVLLVSEHGRNCRVLVVAALTVAMAYLGYFAYFADLALLGSLAAFAARWTANASIYAVLAFVTDGHRARILCATLLVCVMVLLARSGRASTERAALFIFALLLLSPVVHPWYALWLLALIPVTGDRTVRNAGLIWSGTVVLSYVGWVIAQYLPVYAALMAAALGHYQSGISDPLRKRMPRIPT
ncbi:MAG: glycosyltransferase 87 family protein [Gemmatimonadota bacterium]